MVARYAAHGWQPVVATELEFFVFAPNTDPNEPFQAPLGPDGRRELGYSAFSVSSNNGLRPFFEDVYRCMDALGLVRDTFTVSYTHLDVYKRQVWALLWFCFFLLLGLSRSIQKPVAYLTLASAIFTAWLPGLLLLGQVLKA